MESTKVKLLGSRLTPYGLTDPMTRQSRMRSRSILRQLPVPAKTTLGSARPVNGGTFTLSNLGMYGVDAFIVINPPQAAILAVGHIADRVLPLTGAPVVQPALTLTLSCDHRAVDGARAGAFLQTLAETLEEPVALVP